MDFQGRQTWIFQDQLILSFRDLQTWVFQKSWIFETNLVNFFGAAIILNLYGFEETTEQKRLYLSHLIFN